MAYTAQKWSVSGLSIELGMDRRTLGKKLADVKPCDFNGKTKFYKMKDVVMACFAEGANDPQTEKARLDRLRADRVQHDLEIVQGKIVPLAYLENVLANICEQISSVLDSLPLKIKKSSPKLTGRDIENVRRIIVKTQNTMSEINFDTREFRKVIK